MKLTNKVRTSHLPDGGGWHLPPAPGHAGPSFLSYTRVLSSEFTWLVFRYGRNNSVVLKKGRYVAVTTSSMLSISRRYGMG